VIFRQRRYGLNGEEIIVYKFRSMTVAEDGAKVVQATKNDQRLTASAASCAAVRSTNCRSSSMCSRGA
jgi:putative colanic acid biosynthesis UDP-glucose lipid carrier transferase